VTQPQTQGLEAVRAAAVPRENLAWTHAALEELHWQVGDLARAEAAFRDA
jgi:hypothetical protein